MPELPENPKITIVLLNYERPQNIPIILDAISKQTIRATVFLWNNGSEDVNSPLIDRYERSDSNVGCMARWKMAKTSDTPYVMSMDDDICFLREDALERVVQSLDNQDDPNRIIGLIGASFGANPDYNVRTEFMARYGDTNRETRNDGNTYQVNGDGSIVNVIRNCVDRDEAVDVVKGRVMAFKRELINNIELPQEREDDIFLSATLASKARKFHRIPALLHDCFYELPEYGKGNWHKEGHITSRNRALRQYFAAER
jgi:GT2 family glycosyltransferase